jgi:ribonuclease-3
LLFSKLLSDFFPLGQRTSEIKNRRRRIKEILGFRPGKYTHYELSLIHSSAAIVQNGRRLHNERLEFLGDSVLDLIVAQYLFHDNPNLDEGSLTRARSELVNRAHLNHMAEALGLDLLIIGKFNKQVIPQDVKGNTLEAFIGAIFIDKGLKTTIQFVVQRILKRSISDTANRPDTYDYKSELFMWAQRRRKKVDFIITGTSKTGEDPQEYTLAARIDGEAIGQGTATSKKKAQQLAAREAVFALRASGDLETL